MSVYEDIRARVQADQAHDEKFPCDETMEGARAEIVKDFLEVAERWRLKSEEWDAGEQFVHLRAMVCEGILDLLNEGLWPEEGE